MRSWVKHSGGEDNVAIFLGFFSQTSQELRRKGFESLLRERYPDIQILDRLETLGKVDTAYALTKDLLNGRNIPSGIYIIDGGIPVGVARAVVDAGLAGKVKLVSHDLVDETMEYVSKGVITATLGQDPFAQGHDTVVHLFNHLVTGWRPSTPRLLTAREVVTQENYQTILEGRAGDDRVENHPRAASETFQAFTSPAADCSGGARRERFLGASEGGGACSRSKLA